MTALAKHEWTGCQLTNLLEALLSDESAAAALLRLRPGTGFRADTIPIPEDEDPANMLDGDVRLEHLRRMKEYNERMRRYYEQKYALQFLQGTRWIQDAEAAGWIVRTPKGFTPTEMFGESPVADKMRELEMEHIKICTRIGEAESPLELAPHQKIIWRQIKAKGPYLWYFPYHRLFRRYRPAGIAASPLNVIPQSVPAPPVPAPRPASGPRTASLGTDGTSTTLAVPRSKDTTVSSAGRRASIAVAPSAASPSASSAVPPASSTRVASQPTRTASPAVQPSTRSSLTRTSGTPPAKADISSANTRTETRSTARADINDTEVRVAKRPRISASPISRTPSEPATRFDSTGQASAGPGPSTLAHRLACHTDSNSGAEAFSGQDEAPSVGVDSAYPSVGSRKPSHAIMAMDGTTQPGSRLGTSGLQKRIGTGTPVTAIHDSTANMTRKPLPAAPAGSPLGNVVRATARNTKLSERILGSHALSKHADISATSNSLRNRLSGPRIFDTMTVDTDSDSETAQVTCVNRPTTRPAGREHVGHFDSGEDADEGSGPGNGVISDAAPSTATAPTALPRQSLSSRITSIRSHSQAHSPASAAASGAPIDPDDMAETLNAILNPRRHAREERNRARLDTNTSFPGAEDYITPTFTPGLGMSRTGSATGSQRFRPRFSVNPSGRASRPSRTGSGGRMQGIEGGYQSSSSFTGTDTSEDEDEDQNYSAPDDVLVTPSHERSTAPSESGAFLGDAPIARGRNVLGFSFGPSNKPRTSNGTDMAEAEARARARAQEEGIGDADGEWSRRKEPLVLLDTAREEGTESPEVRYRGIVIDDGTLDEDGHEGLGGRQGEDHEEEGSGAGAKQAPRQAVVGILAAEVDMLYDEHDTSPLVTIMPATHRPVLQPTARPSSDHEVPDAAGRLTVANLEKHDKDETHERAENNEHDIITIDDDDNDDYANVDGDDWIMDLQQIAHEDDLDGFMAALDEVSRDVDM